MTYIYSLLRFVPDPARGEAVNIGALAGDDSTGDWDLRLITNYSRAKQLDTDQSLGAALSFLDDVQARLLALDMLPGIGGERMSAELLTRWASEMRNVVQFSDPAPVVASSAAQALDVVFAQLVVEPARRKFRFAKKYQAVTAAAVAFRQNNVPDEAIAARMTVKSGLFRDSFDFGVHNGKMLQLVKCWSFQLPGQDELAEQVKAWAWLVERLHDQGGSGITESDNYDIATGTEVAVVYVPPLTDQDAPSYPEARSAFDQLNVLAVDDRHASEVAERANTLLLG